MPYVSLPPPYGLQGSLAWLQRLQQHVAGGSMGLEKIREEVSTLERKVKAATLEMQRIWGDIWFEKTLIAAPGSVAVAMAEAVRTEWLDTGWLTVLAYDKPPSYPVPDCIDTFIEATGDSQVIERLLAELEGGLLLAGSNEKAMLQQNSVSNVVCQNIALPVYDEVILSDRPFMGIQGACHMLERLWNQYIAYCQRQR